MRVFTFLALLLLTVPASAQVTTGDAALDEAFTAVLDKDFKEKLRGIDLIADAEHPKKIELLRSILDGSLRHLRAQKRLVLEVKRGDERIAVDVFTGEELGSFSKRKFRKISINNAIRTKIDGLLAMRDLEHEDPEVRLAAVNSMISAGEIQIDELSAMLEKERDPGIREVIEDALSLGRLFSESPEERLVAIKALRDSVSPTVRSQLLKISNSDESADVRTAAGRTLERIEQRVTMFGYFETFFFGLSLGSVLVLAAIGLAITFGVMGVINMAHGELIMLGAYTTYLIQQAMPTMSALSLVLAIPGAFVVSGLVGIAIERGIIRHLYGRPLETLLATFGISLILQQLVRTVISPQNVVVSNPEFMSGSFEFNAVLSLTYNRLYIFAFCIVVFIGLSVLLRRTSLGLQVRAVAQNRSMARAMGVRSARVDALTFGLGSGIAGIAGVALSQITNVGPNLGQQYIVDSFLVVVFGGVGNLWGTLLGGLSLGIGNKILEPWAGAVLAKIFVLVFIILFIQKRPRGIFPQKGRAAEN